jgi:hypothetical protein
MADPSKYTRRRKQQVAEQHTDNLRRDTDPLANLLPLGGTVLPWGAWLGVLVALAVVIGLSWRGWL